MISDEDINGTFVKVHEKILQLEKNQRFIAHFLSLCYPHMDPNDHLNMSLILDGLRDIVNRKPEITRNDIEYTLVETTGIFSKIHSSNLYDQIFLGKLLDADF